MVPCFEKKFLDIYGMTEVRYNWLEFSDNVTVESIMQWIMFPSGENCKQNREWSLVYWGPIYCIIV